MGNFTIKNDWGNVTIKNDWGNVTIKNGWGNVTIKNGEGNFSIEHGVDGTFGSLPCFVCLYPSSTCVNREPILVVQFYYFVSTLLVRRCVKGTLFLGQGATVFDMVPSITSVYNNGTPIVHYTRVIQLCDFLKGDLFGEGSHNIQHGTKRT